MNTSRKLLLLTLVAVAAYGGLLVLPGRTDGQAQRTPAVAESLDATMFGARIDDTPMQGRLTSAAGLASLDADAVGSAGSTGSAEAVLERLRAGCQGWLRKLGYSDIEERQSSR